jgi:hypothetical protein
MKECDNSKIHINNNFILSTSLLIMFDTLLLRPSLHCNTPLHFTTLHPTTLHYTSPYFTQPHFTTLRYTSPHFTQLHFTTLHPTTLHYTSLHFTTPHSTTLHYTSPNYTSLHLSTLHFLTFTLHYPLIWLNPFTFPIVLFHLTFNANKSLTKTGCHERETQLLVLHFSRRFLPPASLRRRKTSVYIF